MFTIPDIGTITNFTNGFDGQAALSTSDLIAIAQSAAGTGVVSGCAVSPTTGMNVKIAAGAVSFGRADPVSVAASTVTLAGATAHDRVDLVVASSAGAVSVVKGTPCSVTAWTRTTNVVPPVLPSIAATHTPLAAIYVVGSGTVIHETTAIATKNIIDKRCTAAVGSVVTVTLATNVTVTHGSTKTVVTLSLGVGTWVIDAPWMATGGAFQKLSAWVALGTATGSVSGPSASRPGRPATSGEQFYIGRVHCIVSVTAAGTVRLAMHNGTSTNRVTVGYKVGTTAGTTTSTTLKVTGITAVRVG